MTCTESVSVYVVPGNPCPDFAELSQNLDNTNNKQTDIETKRHDTRRDGCHKTMDRYRYIPRLTAFASLANGVNSSHTLGPEKDRNRSTTRPAISSSCIIDTATDIGTVPISVQLSSVQYRYSTVLYQNVIINNSSQYWYSTAQCINQLQNRDLLLI